MSDLEKKYDEYPSTSTLSKQGITAVACTAAGIFLIILQGIIARPVAAFIIGGIVCIIGIASLLSKDTTDKKAGAIIGGAGVLVLLSTIPRIGAIAKVLMTIGAVGLLALGIWNAIKFFRGLKKRS